MTDLTLAQAVFLMSFVKPVVFLVVAGGWAWVVSKLDTDADYYYLPRKWTNLVLLLTGALGLGLMLLIPIFILGLFVGLLPLVGGILGYAYYRNTKVPEQAKWSLSLDSFRQKMSEREHEAAQRHATLTLMDQHEGRLEVPSGDTPEARAHATLEDVIDFAVPRGAEQIDIVVDQRKAAMVARVDGVKYPQPPLEPTEAIEVIDYLKKTAGLEVEDRRKKQVGTLRIDTGEHGRHTLTLTTSGSTRGLTMAIEIDAAKKKQMGMDEIGLLEAQAKQVAELVNREYGTILIASPPRQGLTTTLYSFLQEHDPYTQSVVTLEDEEVFEIEGVSHNRLPQGTAAAQFNEKLGQITRTDPAVVGLNRVPDADTARLIAKSAHEIRFYGCLQLEDTFKVLRTWVKAVGDPKLAANSLQGVVAQRLVRRLCETCKTPYNPDPAAVKKLNLPADRVNTLYHATGQVVVKDKPRQCPMCHGIGYRGRIGVFEVMVLDDEARKLIAAQDLERLRVHLRKNRMINLQEAALAKVVEGLTDIKEVTRALGEKTKQSASAA